MPVGRAARALLSPGSPEPGLERLGGWLWEDPGGQESGVRLLAEGRPSSPWCCVHRARGLSVGLGGTGASRRAQAAGVEPSRLSHGAGSRVAPESKWFQKQHLRVLMKSLWGSGWGWGAGLPGRGVGVGSPHQPGEKVGPEKPWGGGGCLRVCWAWARHVSCAFFETQQGGFPPPWQGWHPPSLSHFSQGLDSALGRLCPPHCPRLSRHLQGARGVSGWSAQGVVFGDRSSAAGAGLAVSQALWRGL